MEGGVTGGLAHSGGGSRYGKQGLTRAPGYGQQTVSSPSLVVVAKGPRLMIADDEDDMFDLGRFDLFEQKEGKVKLDK
eukprot:1339662-Amorphochlora_amoeboformis.AAC.4